MKNRNSNQKEEKKAYNKHKDYFHSRLPVIFSVRILRAFPQVRWGSSITQLTARLHRLKNPSLRHYNCILAIISTNTCRCVVVNDRSAVNTSQGFCKVPMPISTSNQDICIQLCLQVLVAGCKTIQSREKNAGAFKTLCCEQDKHCVVYRLLNQFMLSGHFHNHHSPWAPWQHTGVGLSNTRQPCCCHISACFYNDRINFAASSLSAQWGLHAHLLIAKTFPPD